MASMGRAKTEEAVVSTRSTARSWVRRERKPLTALAFSLGFSQGCGLCFYVGSGSYFSAVMGNPNFFIDACAFFYLPPIVVTLGQLLADRRFDELMGIRSVIRFRITFSSLLVAVLLALMGKCAQSEHYEGQGKSVFLIGTFLGCFGAVLLGSSCLLFGAVDPRFVPFLVMGQTAAGVYTNVAARLLGFEPGCETWRARAYFGLATGTVLLITVAYCLSNSCSAMEGTYRHHEELLEIQQQAASELRLEEATPGSPAGRRRWCCRLGFPWICWSMAAAQTVAIAMNMSLTPLSNQVARGEYDLSQQLLLTKLLSDFVGRSMFLLIVPRPRSSVGSWRVQRFSGVGGQAVLVWLVEMLRFPLWLSVYLWGRGSNLPWFLANKNVLLWAVWLPMVSSGAFSASWAFVVSVTAAPQEKKGQANLLMSFSVYAGFSVGIVIALLTG